MNNYIGNWVSLDSLSRELIVGDWVMVETLDDTLVVEISKIRDGELWHYNGWTIPLKQIVAVKES